MKKLYVKNDDGTFEEVSAIIAGRDFETIVRTHISKAINEYIKLFSSAKKSSKIEKIFFNEIELFLTDLGINFLDDVEQRHVELFQQKLLKKKSAASVNRQFTTYAHFFKKCVESKYIIQSPFKNVKRKPEKKPIRILWTAKEIDDVLKVSPKWFKLAFLFLALTGSRPIELCNIRKKDYNSKDESITLFCDKGSKGSRLLPLSQPAAKILEILTKGISDSEIVFKSSVQTKLTTDRLNKTLAKIQKRHHLKKNTIYSLRHTYATNLCNKDVNIEKVRLLLGHEQIRTTLKYVKIDFLELKKVVNDD